MSKTATNPINNPFQFATEATSNTSHKLSLTPELIATANSRAAEIMVTVSKNPEMHALANAVLDDGKPADLIELIGKVFSDEQIKTDAAFLVGADDDILDRLLESRRSDRSKAKTKGPRTNSSVCQTYMASMYAELMIRTVTGKPYSGSSSELDATDLEAISRKVKSLQSKKSRLNKLAEYDTDAATELKEITAEIARLNAMRPTTRASSKVVIKDVNIDQLRTALKEVDVSNLPDDQQAKLLELMAKLG